MSSEWIAWAMVVVAGAAAWFAGSVRARLAAVEREKELESQVARLEAQMEAERAASVEKLAILEQAKARLAEEFKALSLQALADNNKAFLDLAKSDFDQKRQSVDELVKPMREQLERFGEVVRGMEKERVDAYGALRQQLGTMAESQMRLQSETANLVKALRAPATRGRWGEITLRRVVELVGMQAHCDFTEQTTVQGESGKLRPDMIVRLPGGKSVVVDSKVALEAYLNGLEATDEVVRATQLRVHARQVRDHVEALAAKSYWAQFEESPEIVVMFVPLETAFSAAVEQDPELIEWAVSRRVIPASPMTLIALLQAVHYGWKQERMSENARRISDLGRELHDRIAVFAGHLAKVGKNLSEATKGYNDAVGSMERMVLSKARQLKALGAGSTEKEIGELPEIELAARRLVDGEGVEG